MNEIVALLEALRPILERWYLLLFAIVLVTLLGIPARVLVGSIAAERACAPRRSLPFSACVAA